METGVGELQMLGTSTLSNNPAAPGRIYVAEGMLSFNSTAALGGADTEILLYHDPGFYTETYPPVTFKYLGMTAGVADQVTLTGLRALQPEGQTILNVAEAEDTLALARPIGNSLLQMSVGTGKPTPAI